MKKFLSAALAALTLSTVAFAGGDNKVKEEVKAHLKPYGFIRSYAFYDTRATKSLTEDLFFFIPLDRQMAGEADHNAVGNFGYQAITTRLGLDIKEYRFGNTGIEGKIEADFYCLNSGGNVATLRMRQAYVKLNWEPSDKFSHNLLIGQTWHPLAADMAHTIALETGAPFTPFNRSAQIMYNANLGKAVTLTAGFIEQLQYRSNGPAGSTNKYQRHAIVPEAYLGISVKAGGFLGRIGASALSIRPHYGYITTTGTLQPSATFTDVDGNQRDVPLGDKVTFTNYHETKYKEWLTTFNPFIFLQYTAKNSFQVKAKAVYAQSGEHMQLNGGYAATALKEDGYSYEYAPTQALVSFVSAQYGKRFQVLGMVGYHKNLGLAGEWSEMLINPDNSQPVAYYFSGNGFKNINQMLRVSPTVAYNLGKMQFALEYDYTMVQYGNGFNRRALVTEGLHWVGNHRILAMAKFSF